MQETTNYKLKKQELTDKADITQISGNWDTIDTELASRLNTSGGTITGELTVKGMLKTEQPIRSTKAEFLQTQVDVVKGVAPEATKYSYISMFDKNGWGIADNRLAHIDYMVGADGAASMVMSVNKFEQASGETAASLFVRYQADGTPRIFLSHHPKKESNSQDIATTGWVRQLAATTSEYGLVKLADTTAALLPTDPLATVNVPLLYELADYRRLNTAYNVGDRVACAFQFDFYLECTQAGTTGGETLDTRSVTHGQTINDGSVIWTVRKAIKSVNGALPDADGNVTLDVEVDLSNYVTLDGNQTVTGAKKFNTMEVAGSTVLRGQTSANMLHVTGAETNDSALTVTGKTTLNGGVAMSGECTAPTPTDATHVANKQYVDSQLGNVFPSGTQLLFYQAAAPTGWTIVTGIEESTVKIVSTGGGTLAGSANFSNVFTSLSTSSNSASVSGSIGSTTLTTSHLPSHRHSATARGNTNDAIYYQHFRRYGDTNSGTVYTDYAGSGSSHTHSFSGSIGSHSHTVNLAVKYINVIVCKKD